MTVLRHRLLDSEGHPVAGHQAAVWIYQPRPDLPSGTYRRMPTAYAVSDDDGWLEWVLPRQTGDRYAVAGIEDGTTVLVTVPSTVSTATVTETRTGTVTTDPGQRPLQDWVTEAELTDRLAALGAAYGSAPSVVGFGNLTHWKTARARVLAGTGDAKILCVGDSTTAGVGGGDSTHPEYQGGALAYPHQLAEMLTYGGLAAAQGLAVPPPAAGGWDPRWAATSGWTPTALGWGAQADWQAPGTAPDALIYVEPGLCDRFDVYYLKSPTFGNFDVNGYSSSAGATTSVVTTGTKGIAKVTVSAPVAGAGNSLWVTPRGGGAVHIVGVEAWLSTAKRVRVGNGGVGGTQATQWASDTSDPAFSAAECIKSYAPDLTVISLGINDAGGSSPVATVLAALDVVITAAQVSGDTALLLPTMPTSAGDAPRLTFTPQYAHAQRGLGLPYVDTARAVGTGNAQNARGRMFDFIHPNGAGYADLAQVLAGGLLAA